MPSINKQLRKLYLFNALGNLSIAGAAWVLLLSTRGFSLVQIGIAETVFHLVSIIAEIPSGVFADVMGRRKSLMVSCAAAIISGLTMAFWDSFTGVCVSVAFSALNYNFFSGTDNALAYDSMLECGCEQRYDGYVSNQTIIYRVTNGLATLAAGLAVILGNRTSQLIGIALSLAQFTIVCTLKENAVTEQNRSAFSEKVAECVRESARFLKGNKTVALLIFRNALVGAVDTLLLFFLQAKLPMTGINDSLLGPLLFIMSMGGVLGARASVRFKDKSFGRIFAVCLTLVTVGFLSEFSGVAWLMTLGGFMAAFADDLIQIRADVELNSIVPPAQRATLISVNSLCFSIVMIFMSPLAGWVFSL